MDVPGKWLDRVRHRRSLDKLILDLNCSVSETHGCREHYDSADGESLCASPVCCFRFLVFVANLGRFLYVQ